MIEQEFNWIKISFAVNKLIDLKVLQDVYVHANICDYFGLDFKIQTNVSLKEKVELDINAGNSYASIANLIGITVRGEGSKEAIEQVMKKWTNKEFMEAVRENTCFDWLILLKDLNEE